ncbi:MAG: thiol reductase thioredoxin [Acidobacteria bacterium]|nr:MAG: thiol reductase thioredoxin [Acidobacteriota bacterium]
MTVDYLAESHAPTREEIDRTPGLVVLEFGTDWCGFCRAAAPQVESLVRRHPRVKLWPNLVFLRDGVVVRQLARPSVAELHDAFEALAGP